MPTNEKSVPATCKEPKRVPCTSSRMSTMVNNGHEQTMSDTLVAVEKRNASFCIRKNAEPPVMPNSIMQPSSERLLHRNLRPPALRGPTSVNPNISTYAMRKRKVKMCAGERPA